jgi:hypothetical protein
MEKQHMVACRCRYSFSPYIGSRANAGPAGPVATAAAAASSHHTCIHGGGGRVGLENP